MNIFIEPIGKAPFDCFYQPCHVEILVEMKIVKAIFMRFVKNKMSPDFARTLKELYLIVLACGNLLPRRLHHF